MIEVSAMQMTIGLVVFVVSVVAQTGMMFYWGGNVSRALKEHERRLNKLEEV
ncbi:hypothetical protein LCGC14_2962650 [marine sediment metagenome]|uniref:Uncharacterized protein n=1 Tax=marine sediment metagenome TaxID=412755 RepID=A0A0F9A326_9ZZZZ